MELKIGRYNDSWMDNALENFYSLLNTFDYNSEIFKDLNEICLEITCEKEIFKKVLVDIFENYKQYVCVNQIDDNGVTKEFKKDFIVIQHKRKGEYINLNPKIFQNPQEEVSKLVDLLETGSKKCVFCGSSFKKKYSNLTQGSYPFSTKIKSLNGIRTYKDDKYYAFKEYHDSLCPLCYLIGQLGWLTDKLVYRSFVNIDKSYLFLPMSDKLNILHEFKEDYSFLLNNNERWSNIKVSSTNEKGELTTGKFGTLLCFYSRFYSILDEEIPDIYWNFVEIPLGKVKNVKSFDFFMDNLVLDIIKRFVDYDEDIYVLFNSVLFFVDDSPNWDLTNEIRENLAESFLKNDFRMFTRNFIPKNGGRLSYSSKNINFLKYFDFLIKLWRLDYMSISEDDLKCIKSVGNIIAKVSITNSSLFYKLDKIKNIADFWSCLREISRKLVNSDMDKSKIRELSLDELIVLLKRNENNWKEIRDLLIIYAAMYYSIGSRSGDNNDN